MIDKMRLYFEQEYQRAKRLDEREEEKRIKDPFYEGLETFDIYNDSISRLYAVATFAMSCGADTVETELLYDEYSKKLWKILD